MSENNEKNFPTDEESFSRLPLVKVRVKTFSDLRHPRQKFSFRWEKEFPWLKADNISESLGICTICNTHLVCKRSHLERHQKSFKHQRHLPAETLNPEDEGYLQTVPQFLECGKFEPEDEEDIEHAIEVGADSNLKIERNLKQDNRKKQSHKIGCHEATIQLDRFKLLKRIDRDRNELNEYYYASRKSNSSTPHTQTLRDSFDLFFESVSASVKTLPPRLAAEVKSRISQIIAEFEVKAICEREALEQNITETSNESAIAVTSNQVHEITTDFPKDNAINSSAVPHIVYTFQPKLT